MPQSRWPRGMQRQQAADYLGISASWLDQLVSKSLLPQPRQLNKRLIWDREELDRAFEELPHRGDDAPGNEWDRAS